MSGDDVATTDQPDAVAALLRRRLEDGTLELPVSGASMSGVIASGSTVVLTSAPGPRIGEIWAFVNDAGDVVVHRVREYDGATVTARGAGNPVDDEPVAASRLIGRVVEARHGGIHRQFGSVDRRRAALEMGARRRLRRVVPHGLRRRLVGRGRNDLDGPSGSF